MKAMETIQDLIEEAKIRTIWWAICVFAVTYFLSHTSTSMWMNLPIGVLIVCGLRILFEKVEFSWKFQRIRKQTYLSHLEKKQISVNDPRLNSAPPPPQKWKKKIDAPIVEAAINEFIDKILKDFVIDLWYSEITPTDKEGPELIRAIIMDALSEISGRVKEINIVDLLTRDIIDLIGDHLDLFRRNQAAIGVDVMKTLSSEERDERLKYHLMASKQLHPANISPESEYKVLQRIVAAVISVVLRPREAQCPIVRTIAREIVTCLILQPLLNLVNPAYINELIEMAVLALKEGSFDQFTGEANDANATLQKNSSCDNPATGHNSAKHGNREETSSEYEAYEEDPMQARPGEWAHRLEVATQRRTEVLTPENLENMWTKGRNYKTKEDKGVPPRSSARNTDGRIFISRTGSSTPSHDKAAVARLAPGLSLDTQLNDGNMNETSITPHVSETSTAEGSHTGVDSNVIISDGNRSKLKRSNSTSDLHPQGDIKKALIGDGGGPFISEFYSPNFAIYNEEYHSKRASDVLLYKEGMDVPKLRCRVIGAYFEKLGSKSFAVYSIAVTDAENRTWFVKRRYSNFERLHRHLKEIPNYNLHLPPKRIFSSSTEDSFVHQRCIQLDRYLQDLLSIANVAEQHEVWDFVSFSSKNYSFGKSSSVMRTLAVNVDDAMDDIMRQVKGYSGGLMRVVGGSSPPHDDVYSAIYSPRSPMNADELADHIQRQAKSKTLNISYDTRDVDEDVGDGNDEDSVGVEATNSHSENEWSTKSLPSRFTEHIEKSRSSISENLGGRSELIGLVESHSAANLNQLEDPAGMPPEWTPPNVSVPVLNLVDNVFQLKRRGWLRRQVFWMSKEIIHLVMEDAIDDWLMRQICWLRNEETIALGIRWVQDILWPGGIFFTRARLQSKLDTLHSIDNLSQIGGSKVSKPATLSFEEQLEATRRASDFKKLLFDGAPTTLVSFIGHKQYRRCARDIYYFTQSTICVKQVTYAILELLLTSVFPELREVFVDIHQKMGQSA